MEPDSECDQEISGIIGRDNLESMDELEDVRHEVEIENASQVPTGCCSGSREEGDKILPAEALLFQQFRWIGLDSGGGGGGGEGSGSGSEPGSHRSSRGQSPSTKTSSAALFDGSSADIRLKLGGLSGIAASGMASGRTSRKGSSCSTPVSSARAELDYPSPNFVRNHLVSLDDECQGVSIDESQRLTIRLHYNPVMDEWVSLTDESVRQAELNTQDLDTLFDLHKTIGNFVLNDKEVVCVGQFFKELEATGIRREDPRLRDLMENLSTIKREFAPEIPMESLTLDRNQFKRAVRDDIALLSRAFKNQFVVPEFGNFCDHIRSIYNVCQENREGKVASYIPQLARYDPNYWGISICTVDGQRFSIGDTGIPFTIQSSSKPFTYGVCLNELGRDTVHQYVGQEPSGRMFNELSLDNNNKPHNPFLNSGAIMSSAILLNLINPEMSMSEKFDFVSDYFKRIAGGEFLSFNNSVFLSERETADRNYALAYYMKENRCFPKGFGLQDCLDFYFQTCSMEVNSESLAVMGSTLANGGVCPITGEEVLRPEAVRDVLSLMHSCGMYNYSGQYAFDVGLPAKSGVSGALVLVVPNVMGIGIFSPALDALGNSVRGVQFSKELVKFFRFHRFDNLLAANTSKVDPRHFKDECSRQSTLCLLYSATTGDLTALKRFYYSNIRMTASNYDGRTALHLACAEGHLSCVKFLVEVCQLDLMQKDRWGFTPIIEARRFRHEGVVEYLVKYLQETYPEKLRELCAK